MKRNECVNPFSVPEILRVTDGQTSVNLLSFNQFHHDTETLRGSPAYFSQLHLLLKERMQLHSVR